MPTFIPIERDPNAEVKQAFVYNEDFNINTSEFDSLSAAQKQIIENFINENTTNGNFLASGTIISFNFDAAEPVWDASNGLKLNEDGQIVRRPTNSEWFVSVDDDGSIRLVEKEENGNVQYDGENFGWTIGENDNSLDGYLIGGEKVSKLIKEAEDNDETLGDYLKKQTNLSEEELADLNLNMNLIKEKYEEEQAQRDIANAAAERADETPVYDETFDETPTESDEVPQPEQEQEPEPEPEQKPQPEEPTEEKPEEQPEKTEEQTKKKLRDIWDTIREGLSDFTKRFKREQDVKAEIVESQNQGLEPVSEEKQPEEKQLSPEEIMKIDACTAIMMAHLEKYNIRYNSQTVKGIVQAALTGYAVALGSDRPLGDLRDANTTKRLISDVMNRITNDIQNRFGDQPIKVTTTVSFGKDEVRTIAKQMSSVLKIPNDDDHLGNSIRTTLVEDFKIAAPLTVLYKSALEDERDAKQEIAKRDKKIEELTSERDKAQQTFAKLDDALQSEIGFTYSKLIGSGLANPDLFNSEISNTIRNCQTAHNDLENANAALNEKQSTDLKSKLEAAEEKIKIIEKNLREEEENGIGFIKQLNLIAVSSEEIPAPENPYSPELKEVFADVEKKEKVPDEQHEADVAEESAPAAAPPPPAADGQSQNDGAATEQHEVNDPASATTPATDGQDGATELSDPATIDATTPVAQDSVPATPLDPTSETPVTEEINLGASEESASATEQPASADATPSDPTPEEQRESAQTDVDKPTDVITTDAPASKSNGQNNTPNTMAKNGGSLTVRKGEGQDYTGKGQGEEVTETTRQGKGYRK